MAERRANPWIAFAAGAVAMLAIGLLVFAWIARRDAADVLEGAVRAVEAAPDIVPPRIPDAPRLARDPSP